MSALGEYEIGPIGPVEVHREMDASVINAFLNAPDIRPWIADAADGEINVQKQIEHPDVIFLMGEHGGVMLHRYMPEHFEVHTFVESAGRGAWALGMIKSAQHWLFTKTDAKEVLTRIPETHRAALGLTIKAGMTHEFVRPDGVKINGKTISVDIYRLSLQDWIKKAPWLIEKGAQFHEWLNAKAAVLGFSSPHDNDDNHNRYVGAVLEMFLGGQPVKATQMYNRWAVISRHAPIKLVSLSPPTIDMDIGQLKLSDGNLEFAPWKKSLN